MKSIVQIVLLLSLFACYGQLPFVLDPKSIVPMRSVNKPYSISTNGYRSHDGKRGKKAHPDSVQEIEKVLNNVRLLLDAVYPGVPSPHCREYEMFAFAVANDWKTVLANIGTVATNNLERQLILGVGLQYGEDFYIDFCMELCDAHTIGAITAQEMESAMAPKRHDLNSCLIRRYQEPKVVELVNKLKIAMPQQESRWNDILSGAAYTNYLEEVAMGLRQ